VSTTASPIGKPDLPAPPTSKQWQKNERSSKNLVFKMEEFMFKKIKNYYKTNKIRFFQKTKNLDDRLNFWSHGKWCDVVFRWVGI
jgi:hypothetical protein